MLFCDQELEIGPLKLLEGLAIGFDGELKFVGLQVAIHLQRLLAFRLQPREACSRFGRQNLHQRGAFLGDLVVAALERCRVNPVLEALVECEGRYDSGLDAQPEEPDCMLAEAEHSEAAGSQSVERNSAQTGNIDTN